MSLHLAVWSPLPPSSSGIADYVAETLPLLAREVELTLVVERPEEVEAGLRARHRVVGAEAAGAADLHLYHLGNSPAHAYAYRAALRQPGVVVLHDWSLHHLVLRETVERGEVSAYLQEMRRAHGARGTFVARQVARALGGDVLPALYPLNDRVLEGALAVVALSANVAARVGQALPGRPVLHLPHHFACPLSPAPSRAEARGALGLPADALLLTAPGLATAAKELRPALGALRALGPRFPALRLVVAGAVDPRLPLLDWARELGVQDRLLVTGRLSMDDFLRHLLAADVVLALRFPSYGEMSGALVRALGLGRAALVSAGTPPAEEFPEGVVVPVDPGPYREAELEALLLRLLADAALRDNLGAMARAHVLRQHDLASTVAALTGFLRAVHGRVGALRAEVESGQEQAGGLLGYYLDEARVAARGLGLLGLHRQLEPRLRPLAERGA